jgi:hypothetical protein
MQTIKPAQQDSSQNTNRCPLQYTQPVQPIQCTGCRPGGRGGKTCWLAQSATLPHHPIRNWLAHNANQDVTQAAAGP